MCKRIVKPPLASICSSNGALPNQSSLNPPYTKEYLAADNGKNDNDIEWC
jgi:hypothetical protein